MPRDLVLLLAVGLAACAAGPGHAVVTTADAPAAIGPYSQAIAAGDFVFVAGQIGVEPATRELVAGGVVAEAGRALTNVGAILAAAGCTLADVVQAQVFLADLGDYAAFNEVYAGFFPAPAPARAAVQVAALPKGARVEVMVIARRR